MTRPLIPPKYPWYKYLIEVDLSRSPKCDWNYKGSESSENN